MLTIDYAISLDTASMYKINTFFESEEIGDAYYFCLRS